MSLLPAAGRQVFRTTTRPLPYAIPRRPSPAATCDFPDVRQALHDVGAVLRTRAQVSLHPGTWVAGNPV